MQAYDNGKLAFSYVCPVKDMGIPMGYKSTRDGRAVAVRAFKELKNKPKSKKKPFLIF